MVLGSPWMGLSEYLILYALGGVVLLGVLGWMFGTGLGGVVVFILGAAIAIILIYAVLTRVWTYLLHGTIDPPNRGGGF